MARERGTASTRPRRVAATGVAIRGGMRVQRCTGGHATGPGVGLIWTNMTNFVQYRGGSATWRSVPSRPRSGSSLPWSTARRRTWGEQDSRSRYLVEAASAREPPEWIRVARSVLTQTRPASSPRLPSIDDQRGRKGIPWPDLRSRVRRADPAPSMRSPRPGQSTVVAPGLPKARHVP
jgi:hypothetical protein